MRVTSRVWPRNQTLSGCGKDPQEEFFLSVGHDTSCAIESQALDMEKSSEYISRAIKSHRKENNYAYKRSLSYLSPRHRWP